MDRVINVDIDNYTKLGMFEDGSERAMGTGIKKIDNSLSLNNYK